MIEQGLRAVIRRRRRYASYQNEQGRIAANEIKRTTFCSIQIAVLVSGLLTKLSKFRETTQLDRIFITLH